MWNAFLTFQLLPAAGRLSFLVLLLAGVVGGVEILYFVCLFCCFTFLLLHPLLLLEVLPVLLLHLLRVLYFSSSVGGSGILRPYIGDVKIAPNKNTCFLLVSVAAAQINQLLGG